MATHRLDAHLRDARHLGDTAAALVPVVIGRLRDIRNVDNAELESLVAACAADIDRVGRLAASVERDMSDLGVPPRRRAALAGLLFGGAVPACGITSATSPSVSAASSPSVSPRCSARTPSGEISLMKRSSSVQFGESAGRATAVAHRAARVLHEQSTKTQGGMERADEPAELVFPPPPLVARVIVGPVPEVAPARSPASSKPSSTTKGGSSTGASTATRPYVASDLMDYAEWRGSWERTWELGPLTNLRSLQPNRR